MPPAVIAGGVAAAGTIGGALISSHSQSKAADQAQASQDAATQAQLQLGQQSLGQARDIYNSNFGLLSPFVSRGNVAGDAINALLGLPAAPKITNPLQAAPTGTGSGSSATGTPAPPSSIAQILPMANDGIPGNYQSALQQYYTANPQSLAQIQALKNDGIPGNYQAAMAAYNSMPHTTATPGVQYAPVVSQMPVTQAVTAPLAALRGFGGVLGGAIR